MTNRELFHATMAGENGRQLLHMEQGFNIVYNNWLKDGLPSNVDNCDFPAFGKNRNLYDYMNVTGYLYCHINQFCVPKFDEELIEETAETKVYRNGNGVVLKERTKASVEGTASFSPPQEIDFTIASEKAYMENRHRLTGNGNLRFDKKWLADNAEIIRTQQDYLPTLWIHGPFAYLRELMGTENAMILPYEEPDLIKMMLKDHLEVSMAAAAPVIEACKPDMCFVWEDCCGSTGPFVSPAIFDELIAPWYRAFKDYLLSMGVRWIMLDTDGDPSPLVSRWYEAGVDCMQPWEVNGVDMLKFADAYPEYVMMGGIYKHMFEPNDLSQVGRFTTTDVHEAIDMELKRVVEPMMKRGRYIAALDHWAFWGTTFDGYTHYSNRLLDYGKANTVTRV
ncbi:uroporphyrinogen decarboxylase family protein [Treponema primitia]|uniref:uroporphyrinogen decarboxylase family protein n=1 Tax=Treponema primitia TaxID=88058 RepID=UPI0002554EB2|nr:uroporphyrinogen decarboxylase family protein [Treponema primitia]